MRVVVLAVVLCSTPSFAAPPTPAEACDRGDGAACLALARTAEPHGAYRVQLSPAEADARVAETVRRAGRACDFGLGEGCLLAGRMVGREAPPGQMVGRGAPPGQSDRSDRQHDLLVRACDLGQPAACGLIGGLAGLEKACLADVTIEGHGTFGERGGFCVALADELREGGKGIKRDKARAARFFAIACKQGHKQDCPCKTDGDCGAEDFLCNDGRCDQLSPD